MDRHGGGSAVTCPACGQQVARRDAREYDRFGRHRSGTDATVEYLCGACHDGLSPHPRDDLEAILVDVNAGRCDRETFLRRYRRVVRSRRGRRRDQ